MNIVLEGPDNSGKSTLAKLLALELDKRVFASEGPEKFTGELRDRVERYRGLHEVIFDRHPCVSDIIYGAFRERPSSLANEHQALFYASEPLMIYCDPLNRGMLGHLEKAHDSQAHISMVNEKYANILRLYREWGISRAHIIYRIGDDPQRIVRFCRDFDPVADVEAFHRRFNIDYAGAPRALPPDLAAFRDRCQKEELREYQDHSQVAEDLLIDLSEGVEGVTRESITAELAGMLDALCDKIYFDLGNARLHGFNFREAWRRVHAANMRKKSAERRSESARHSTFDIVKPPGWQPPDHTDLVSNHIHR